MRFSHFWWHLPHLNLLLIHSFIIAFLSVPPPLISSPCLNSRLLILFISPPPSSFCLRTPTNQPLSPTFSTPTRSPLPSACSNWTTPHRLCFRAFPSLDLLHPSQPARASTDRPSLDPRACSASVKRLVPFDLRDLSTHAAVLPDLPVTLLPGR